MKPLIVTFCVLWIFFFLLNTFFFPPFAVDIHSAEHKSDPDYTLLYKTMYSVAFMYSSVTVFEAPSLHVSMSGLGANRFHLFD